MSQSIIVKHNVEMAHRLSLQPDSKCYNLHGHSWWVELEISGRVNPDGMILDFATVKREWRAYLDEKFDHHLCLNIRDPLVDYTLPDQYGGGALELPGLVTVPCDPTVENMARLWGEHAKLLFDRPGIHFVYTVKVWEASTNAATWRNR